MFGDYERVAFNGDRDSIIPVIHLKNLSANLVSIPAKCVAGHDVLKM